MPVRRQIDRSFVMESLALACLAIAWVGCDASVDVSRPSCAPFELGPVGSPIVTEAGVSKSGRLIASVLLDGATLQIVDRERPGCTNLSIDAVRLGLRWIIPLSVSWSPYSDSLLLLNANACWTYTDSSGRERVVARLRPFVVDLAHSSVAALRIGDSALQESRLGYWVRWMPGSTPGRDRILVTGFGPELFVFETSDSSLHRYDGVVPLACSVDGSTCLSMTEASAGERPTVVVNGMPLFQCQPGERVAGVSLSPSGRRALISLVDEQSPYNWKGVILSTDDRVVLYTFDSESQWCKYAVEAPFGEMTSDSTFVVPLIVPGGRGQLLHSVSVGGAPMSVLCGTG